MKLIRTIIITALISAIITYGVIYFFILSKNIVIAPGENLHGNITLSEGTVTIREEATIEGEISLKSGTIFIGQNTKINGDIILDVGSLTIEKGAQITGNIVVKKGTIALAEKVFIKGNISLKSGEMEKDSSAKITGTKPDIYKTSNWPEALAYFDILPEDHKMAVGYIFLTHGKNTDIRDPEMKNAKSYFDGIYYYQDYDLHTINLDNDTEASKYFERAQKFFTDLPERKLGPFSVGATTKNYAHSKNKADIYVPSNGSQYTFIHEMGHVLDYKEDYSDVHNPMYPFISKEAAVNGYAATHPGEDFAESYRYYVLSAGHFQDLIQENSERQQKYDYLKKYVFNDKEFINPEYS